MKKIYITFIMLIVLASCKKDLTSLNVDPKNPLTVPSSGLFTKAQRVLSNTVTSSNVNLNIFRLIEQQWQETTYTDESNYDLNTRQIPDGVWDSFYRDIIKNLEESKRVMAIDVADAGIRKNSIAIADVMQVYAWYYVVSTFGNVPYSQALNVDNTFPKYDDAKTIYYDLLTRLDNDLAALDPASASLGNADLLYRGNIDSWKKFANTLKLKMGMTIADFDDAKARATVTSAITGGIFTSNTDNATFRYLSAPPNTNPVWVDLVQSGRLDFVACSTITTEMNTLNDPRRPLYFTFDNAGGYSGGEPGQASDYGTFSKPAVSLTAPDFRAILLSYSETEFFLAEAAERGYAISGTAALHYNKAITASILEWGGTTTDVTTYLAQPSVEYTTATGTYKQKIGIQKWISLYNRGYDAWFEQRRLDYPVLIAPADAQSVFPVRFVYPINEQNVNKTNYNQAASAIGGDNVGTKIFWDKF